MACGQAIAQHMGAEAGSLITASSVGGINRDMDSRAGCGLAMKRKAECGRRCRYHDGMAQLIGLIEQGMAQ